jgi:hypothetical protein
MAIVTKSFFEGFLGGAGADFGADFGAPDLLFGLRRGAFVPGVLPAGRERADFVGGMMER